MRVEIYEMCEIGDENESDKMDEIGWVGVGLDGWGWGLLRCVRCA